LLEGLNKLLGPDEPAATKTLQIGFVIIIVLSLLYYYLRFQFNLVYLIPLLQYGLAYGLIGSAGLKWVTKKKSIIHTKVDLWVLLFLAYNLALLPMSFYRYGYLEGLYAIKNYLTGLLLYFAVIIFFDKKFAQTAVKLTMIVCTLVSIVYFSELVSTRYGEEKEDGVILSGELFKYTVRLNRYAMQLEPTGHGVSKSWRKSKLSTFMRLPGPLGHSNATTFVIGLGCILSFAYIIFRAPLKIKVILFMTGFVTLIWGGTRTNIVSALIAMLSLSIWCLLNKKITLFQLLIPFLAGFFLVSLFILLKIIDWEAYGQIMNFKQSMHTVSVILSKANFDKLFIQVTDNPVYLILGYGLAPIFGSTYRGSNYTGYPIVSEDAYFMQFLSQYGILLSLFFFTFFVYSLWDSYKKCRLADPDYFDKNSIFIVGVLAVLVSSFLSALHGAAPFRPQINLVVFILLGSYSVIVREGIRAK
jgi:hypothetical protein